MRSSISAHVVHVCILRQKQVEMEKLGVGIMKCNWSGSRREQCQKVDYGIWVYDLS